MPLTPSLTTPIVKPTTNANRSAVGSARTAPEAIPSNHSPVVYAALSTCSEGVLSLTTLTPGQARPDVQYESQCYYGA